VLPLFLPSLPRRLEGRLFQSKNIFVNTEATIFSYFLSPLALWERGKYRRIYASVLIGLFLAQKKKPVEQSNLA